MPRRLQPYGGRWFLSSLLFLFLLGVGYRVSHAAAPPVPDHSATAFDRNRMLAHLARHVMWPTYVELATATQALPPLATQFCAALSVGHLTTLQQAWKLAVAPLKRSEAFRLGPGVLLASAVDFWPVRPSLIEKVLANPQPITAEFIELAGAAARGVSAMEYLLFDPDGGNTVIIAQFRNGLKGQRRCAYLLGLSQHLAQQAQLVEKAWNPSGGNFVTELAQAGHGSTTYPIVYKAVSEIVNRQLATVEKLYKHKLGRPLLGNGKSPWPESVEAWRSELSLAHLIENLQGLYAVYAGFDGTTDGPGFDDLLTALGSPLAARITQQMQTAIAAVQAIPPPLRQAVVQHPEAVTAAYDAVKVLLILLKVDMTNVLGVTVDFGDIDGD